MSILREDFSSTQIAAIEKVAEASGLPFSAAVRMLIDYGITTRKWLGSELLPHGEPSRRGFPEGGKGGDCGCWEGGGDPGNEEFPVSVPQSFGRARRRAKKNVAEPPAFTEFYDEIYPRKVGRAAALLVWLRLESELPTLDELRAVVAQQIDENDWANPEKAQFIPHPRTWLSQKRWNDKPLRGAVLVQPKPDPAAEAEARRLAILRDARESYENAALALCPIRPDGWTPLSRCWVLDGLDALQSPEDFEARLDHARALIDRLRALGAFPLVAKRADPGLIYPACGGGPWRPFLKGSRGAGIEGIMGMIDDPVPPNPPSAEEISAAHERLTFAGIIPTTLTPLSVPGDIILVGGDPVRREAIERNYGPDTGTIHDPGDGSVSTYFPGPNETDANGDCPRCNGEDYFDRCAELCMNCVDEIEREDEEYGSPRAHRREL